MASSTTMSMAGMLNTVFSKADHKQGPLSIATCKNSKIRCNPNLKFGPAIRLPKCSLIRASKDQEPDWELRREVIGMTVETRSSGDEVTESISKVVIEKQFGRPSAQNGENLGFRKEDENVERELPRETLTHLASESAVEEPVQVHKEVSEEAKHIAPKVGRSAEDVAEKLEEKVGQISETEAKNAASDNDDHVSVTEPEDAKSEDHKLDETRTVDEMPENKDFDTLGEKEFTETGDYDKPGGIFSGVKQSGEFAKQGLTSGKEALEKRVRGFSEASQEAKEKTNIASEMAKKGWESVVHSVEAAQEGMSKLVEQVQKTAGEQIKAVTETFMDEEAKKSEQAKQGKVGEGTKKDKLDNEDPHKAVQYEFHEMRTGEKDYNDNDVDLDDGDGDDDDDDFNLPGEDDSMPRPSSISDRTPHHDDSPGLDVDLRLGDLEDKTTKPSFVQSAEVEQP